jgi:hypothetical protein
MHNRKPQFDAQMWSQFPWGFKTWSIRVEWVQKLFSSKYKRKTGFQKEEKNSL